MKKRYYLSALHGSDKISYSKMKYKKQEENAAISAMPYCPGPRADKDQGALSKFTGASMTAKRR